MLTLVLDLVTIFGFPGALGKTKVTTELDSAEYSPVPAPFTAATRKTYVVPAANPDTAIKVRVDLT